MQIRKVPLILGTLSLVVMLLSHLLLIFVTLGDDSVAVNWFVMIGPFLVGIMLGLLGGFVAQKRPYLGGGLQLAVGGLILCFALLAFSLVLFWGGLSRPTVFFSLILIVSWGGCGTLNFIGGLLPILNPAKFSEALPHPIDSSNSIWPDLKQ